MRGEKLLLVTFSNNADHQDTLFGMYEQLKKDYDVTLLAIKNPKVALEKSVSTWFVDCPKTPGICAKTFDLPLLFTILKRIRKKKITIIYFESLHVWNLPIMIFKPYKTKTYQVIHEVIPHEGDKQEKMVDFMNKIVSRLADVIVLRNKTYQNDMIKRYHIPDKKVKFLELWRRYPNYTEPTYSKKVLFFGRMNPYKGLDNLIEIVKMCPQIQFEIIGKPDLQVQDLIMELSNEKNVYMNTGYVTDEQMSLAFIQADWILVPYNSASQSGIIIDAYKYSRPVIAFSVGAIKEQVNNGKSGFLVTAKDNKKFAEILTEVVQMSKEEYKKMSLYAYEFGKEKYDVRNAKKRFETLIYGKEE